jgi:TP901-1 family phage major tail protein
MGEQAGKNLLLKIGASPALKSQLVIQNLIYRAKTAGAAGNNTTIEYSDSGTGGLSISVASSAIDVDFGGDTPTAAQIKAAIDADGSASALVDVAYLGLSSTVQVATVAATNLVDGFDAVSSVTTVAGLRSKGLTINNEAIDVTNHDSNEFKKLLDEAGIRSFAMTGSGVFTDDSVLRITKRLAIDGKIIKWHVVDTLNSLQYIGFMKIVSVEKAAEYNAEQTYSVSLESDGETILAPV